LRVFQTILLMLVLIGSNYAQKPFSIDSDFPGGNVFVEKINNDTVFVRPDMRDTEGIWFYWNFKVRNAEKNKLVFQFTQDNKFTTFGPAVSIDMGQTWCWLGKEAVQENRFKWNFTEADSAVQFCMSIPYVESHLKSFLNSLPKTELLTIDTLCLTKKGRSVERLILKSPVHQQKHKVLLTARHHACEMMANYVMEGIIEAVLKNDDLEWLRENVEFWIIPFVDKDGVELGDQGKNRRPRDHNRDYLGHSIYYSTAVVRHQVPAWSEGKLKIALDIHCPWIKGDNNEFIYIVGSKDERIAGEQIRFSNALEKQHKGQLPFYAKNYLPYGKAWNTDKNYNKGRSFSGWASTLNGISLAASLEFPYANVHG
jgi:hypothetical protein